MSSKQLATVPNCIIQATEKFLTQYESAWKAGTTAEFFRQYKFASLVNMHGLYHANADDIASAHEFLMSGPYKHSILKTLSYEIKPIVMSLQAKVEQEKQAKLEDTIGTPFIVIHKWEITTSSGTIIQGTMSIIFSCNEETNQYEPIHAQNTRLAMSDPRTNGFFTSNSKQ